MWGRQDAANAQAELDRSLTLLQTDHFDLYQLHAMSSQEDYDAVMAPGGAMEVLRKAKAAGIVKNIGFSAHNEDVACQLIATGEFDSILTAFNYMSWTVGGFGQRMMAAAQDQGNAPPPLWLREVALKHEAHTHVADPAGMAILGIKSLARCQYQEGEDKKYSSCWYAPEEDAAFQERLYKFSLGVGVSVCVSPGTLHHL